PSGRTGTSTRCDACRRTRGSPATSWATPWGACCRRSRGCRFSGRGRRPGRDVVLLDDRRPAGVRVRPAPPWGRAGVARVGAAHIAGTDVRPEQQVEDEGDQPDDDEDPADGVDVDGAWIRWVDGEGQDEPGGGHEQTDSDSHVRGMRTVRLLQP